MTTAQDNTVLFPVARIVQGDLYEPQDEDMQGNKLTVKTGPNAGQERVNFFFAIAIPKTGESEWFHTQWGQRIYAIARAAWQAWFNPQTAECTHPRFAWKIANGDDTTPNPDARNMRNCDREGFPGHWIVRLGSGFATKVFDEAGTPLLQPGLVKRGYWVEVLAIVNSNSNAQKPGLYINHSMVAYRAPGKEIVSGPDPRQVGFGRSALPPGVNAQPLGNTANVPAQAAPAIPGAAPAVPGAAPAVPGGYAAAPAYAAPAVPGAAPAQTPVVPHTGFIQPVGAPAVPGAVPQSPVVAGAVPAPMSVPAVPGAPAAPSVVCPLGAPMGFKMANLNGPRYEAFKGQGWNDTQMLGGGHMVKL